MKRINTIEYILSAIITIVLPIILPCKIIEQGSIIKYGFGFPCTYLYTNNKNLFTIFYNLFNEGNGIRIKIIGLFVSNRYITVLNMRKNTR